MSLCPASLSRKGWTQGRRHEDQICQVLELSKSDEETICRLKKRTGETDVIIRVLHMKEGGKKVMNAWVAERFGLCLQSSPSWKKKQLPLLIILWCRHIDLMMGWCVEFSWILDLHKCLSQCCWNKTIQYHQQKGRHLRFLVIDYLATSTLIS